MSRITLSSEPIGVKALRGITSDKTFSEAYVIDLYKVALPMSSYYVYIDTTTSLRVSPENTLTLSVTMSVL